MPCSKVGREKEALEYSRKALELNRSLVNIVIKDEDLSLLRSHDEFQKLINFFKQSSIESAS